MARNPPIIPLPSLTALLSPFAEDIPTALQIAKSLADVFSDNITARTYANIIAHFHAKYSALLIELQHDEKPTLHRALREFDRTALFDTVARHVISLVSTGENNGEFGIILSPLMYNWLMECAVHEEADRQGTLSRALGDHVKQPYMLPYERAVKITPFIFGTKSPVTELAAAFQGLSEENLHSHGASRLSKEDIYHVLREFVHIGCNLADVYRVDRSVEGEIIDKDKVLRLTTQAVYNCTARRLMDPNSECPLKVKHVLANVGLARACYRMLCDLTWISQSEPNKNIWPDYLGFLLYIQIMYAAVEPAVDPDGSIRAVVEECFDPVWKGTDTSQVPRHYRPFGFEYKIFELDNMYGSGMMYRRPARASEVQNANQAFAGEYTLVDIPIEATGERIDPFSIASRLADVGMSKDDQCTICWTGFVEGDADACLQLECKHLFHASCLDGLVNAAVTTRFVTCPLCRFGVCPAREYRGATE